ncbi:hypothetical protein RRG08_060969 [Elysia crispata]|uniref:ZMIZ1 N-terminal domain-containing protein n=1 Tax=Elysia crispata TaxID=231223 RepID=A0AAE1AV55_9GAST|nr:hypothetical protein RRG08_060969 [Elysia crispata]
MFTHHTVSVTAPKHCSPNPARRLVTPGSLLQDTCQVVYNVASQPGYDFDLGYRLLAVCSSHKDLFSGKAASKSTIQSTDSKTDIAKSLLPRIPTILLPQGGVRFHLTMILTMEVSDSQVTVAQNPNHLATSGWS